MKKTLFALAALVSAGVQASKPVNFSLTPDVAMHSRKTKIEGFTLSIWGENEMSAVSLGVVNGSHGNSSGFSLGVFNYSENYIGAQIAVANWTAKDFKGFLGGVANFVEGSFTGFQWGVVNYTKKLKGAQLGIFNYAGTAEGVAIQVGIANILPENKGWFTNFPDAVAPAMILFNWRFK